MTQRTQTVKQTSVSHRDEAKDQNLGSASVASNRPITRNGQARLEIGKHEMNPFAGLSDGDLFSCKGKIYKIRPSSGGWTLRPIENALGTHLQGFELLPDYQSFVYAVNQAALNGI